MIERTVVVSSELSGQKKPHVTHYITLIKVLTITLNCNNVYSVMCDVIWCHVVTIRGRVNRPSVT